MICDNTFDTGFYFWLGKLAAEVFWGAGVILVLTLLLGLVIYVAGRNRK